MSDGGLLLGLNGHPAASQTQNSSLNLIKSHLFSYLKPCMNLQSLMPGSFYVLKIPVTILKCFC